MRDLVPRFNPYIFSIKYTRFFWSNCFGNIAPPPEPKATIITLRRHVEREFHPVSQAIMTSSVMLFYRLRRGLKDPDYSPFCAPPAHRD
jgi:hypothetical protein